MHVYVLTDVELALVLCRESFQADWLTSAFVVST